MFFETLNNYLYLFFSFFLTAVQSGDVKLWTSKKETSSLLETKKSIDRMRHFDFNSPIIATGGKNNDLKLWDINEQECIFQAKNVSYKSNINIKT